MRSGFTGPRYDLAQPQRDSLAQTGKHMPGNAGNGGTLCRFFLECFFARFTEGGNQYAAHREHSQDEQS